MHSRLAFTMVKMSIGRNLQCVLISMCIFCIIMSHTNTHNKYDVVVALYYAGNLYAYLWVRVCVCMYVCVFVCLFLSVCVCVYFIVPNTIIIVRKDLFSKIEWFLTEIDLNITIIYKLHKLNFFPKVIQKVQALFGLEEGMKECILKLIKLSNILWNSLDMCDTNIICQYACTLL